MYKVDSGKDIPDPVNTGKSKYPFRQMLVGDSFFVPIEGETSKVIRDRVRASSLHFFGESGHVTMRLVKEDGKEGVRVWRIDPEGK